MFAPHVNKLARWGMLCLALFSMTACAADIAPSASNGASASAEQSESPQKGETQLITPEQAKELMDTQETVLILDVRAPDEYAEGHIANAVLIPDYELAQRAEHELPDKTQTILVYCRSGRRSKGAAALLARMGYTNIKDFGGILDWPYDITVL